MVQGERTTDRQRSTPSEGQHPLALFVHDDSGRSVSGFLGETRDCVTRAIAIATGKPYREVYDELHAYCDNARHAGVRARRSSPRTGVSRRIYERYLVSLGWKFIPTMFIGSGCKVHLRPDELPAGHIIARLSGHLCAVVDGVIHDIYDPSRDGTRCVYGYYQKA
jgi:hypothetical protein